MMPMPHESKPRPQDFDELVERIRRHAAAGHRDLPFPRTLPRLTADEWAERARATVLETDDFINEKRAQLKEIRRRLGFDA